MKGESKGSGTAFDWAALSRFIGMRSRRERATAECDVARKLAGLDTVSWARYRPWLRACGGERGVC